MYFSAMRPKCMCLKIQWVTSIIWIVHANPAIKRAHLNLWYFYILSYIWDKVNSIRETSEKKNKEEERRGVEERKKKMRIRFYLYCFWSQFFYCLRTWAESDKVKVLPQYLLLDVCQFPTKWDKPQHFCSFIPPSLQLGHLTPWIHIERQN